MSAPDTVNGAVHQDLVWCHRSPLPESQKIAGLARFYSERVDRRVDGAAGSAAHPLAVARVRRSAAYAAGRTRRPHGAPRVRAAAYGQISA